jgi:hypothetical protein
LGEHAVEHLQNQALLGFGQTRQALDLLLQLRSGATFARESAACRIRSIISKSYLMNVRSNMAELDIRGLKKIIDAIFDRIINDVKIEKLAVKGDRDLYWEVPSYKLYDVKEAPPHLDVGKLADDWEFLQSISKDKDQAVALMLIHVAPLLRHIGQEIGK